MLRTLRAIAALMALAISPATAQNYGIVNFGMDRSSSPYKIGVNLSGTFYNIGQITSGGVWTPYFPGSNCPSSQWQNAVSTLGVFACAQPSFPDISGVVAASQGGAGTINGILRADGAGNVSEAKTGTGAYSPSLPANTEDYVLSFRNVGVTGNGLYQTLFPNVSNYDVVQGVLNVTAGATTTNNGAVAGYVTSASGTSGVNGNGVALFGLMRATADNTPVWGVNTLCQDAASRAVGTGVGRECIGAELDFNIMNPGTQVIGLSVGGNSLAQPTNANGFIVNTLGSGIKWTNGFSTQPGAADVGMILGSAAASGANIDSQPFELAWRDGAGAAQVAVMKMTGGFLSISQTGAWNGLSVAGGNIFLSSGSAYMINGQNTLGLSGSTATLAYAGTPTVVGSAAFKNTGVSGATVPLLDGANTWSSAQTFSDSMALGQMFAKNTAPTISSGFCTSPSVSNTNGTLYFHINVGTGCATSSGVIGLPTANHGWVCSFFDTTSPGSTVLAETAHTTNTVTVTSYGRVSGTLTNFIDGDVIHGTCMGG